MPKTEKERLVLLDTHAILHRAYHALPDFQTKHGEPTGALYGLLTMLLKIIRELKPTYIFACFDRPEETIRKQSFAEYKANRIKADDALIAQLERARDLVAALGIPIYDSPGFEADDMIGTIVEQTKVNKNIEIIIATGDMDTLQLTDDRRVMVYTLRKGIQDTVLYDEKAVRERFGFAPELLVDYKGLRGDPSDNIPGIPGIGEKTATELIKNFGGLDDIYKKLKKSWEPFLAKGVKERIINLLLEHEADAYFSRELGTIRRDAPITCAIEEPWHVRADRVHIENMFDELEFRSLKSRLSEIFPDKKIVPEIEEKMEDKKEDLSGLSDDELEETKIALWLLDSNQTNPEPGDILLATRTRTLPEARAKILQDIETQNLHSLLHDIELPLRPVLRAAESRGILIDVEYLTSLGKEYHTELSRLERTIWDLSGMEFNINSPKQLGGVLFETLGIKRGKVKKTATGAFSTNAAELAKLRGEHPVIDQILEYREYQKLLSTYIDAIPALLQDKNRLHTHFVQTGTTTGRLSSENPNLQNIPIKTELGRKIRTAFRASPGHLLLALDYSQIDLRSLALLSRDAKLMEAFTLGEDIHTRVAAEVFGVSPDKVDKEMRRRAKVINFGIIYGMGVNALRGNLGTGRDEAREFYDKYFTTFEGVSSYLERVKKEAAELGYTETYFSRRRYFPGLRSKIPYVRAQAERMAMNAPIQGTSSDIIKIAMVHADKKIKEKNLSVDAHLLLQVHDELIYEVKKDRLEEAGDIIRQAMEGVLTEVPLAVHISSGAHWGALS